MMGRRARGGGRPPEAYLLGLVTDTSSGRGDTWPQPAWRVRPSFSQAASQHFPHSPRVGLLSAIRRAGGSKRTLCRQGVQDRGVSRAGSL